MKRAYRQISAYSRGRRDLAKRERERIDDEAYLLSERDFRVPRRDSYFRPNVFEFEPPPEDDPPLDDDADAELLAQISTAVSRSYIYNERKHKDFFAGTYAPLAPFKFGSPSSLNFAVPLESLLDISLGTGPNERMSSTIRVVRVALKMIVRSPNLIKEIEENPVPPPVFTDGSASFVKNCFIRIVLVWDKQAPESVAPPSQLLFDISASVPALHVMRDTRYNDRFDILKDEIVEFRMGDTMPFEIVLGGVNLPFVSQQESYCRYECFMDEDRLVHYHDTPALAGTIPDPNLYLLVTGHSVPNQQLEGWFNARVTYEDNVVPLISK